jgi:hypothetical protein
MSDKGRGSRRVCISSPRYVFIYIMTFLCTLLMIIRRLHLWLPPAGSTTTNSNTKLPHIPRTQRRWKRELVGRFYATTHPQPHPRSKRESVGLFLKSFYATTRPIPPPQLWHLTMPFKLQPPYCQPLNTSWLPRHQWLTTTHNVHQRCHPTIHRQHL